MSDYGLSVSDGGVSDDVVHASRGPIWPFGQTGKLLGGGIIGVVLIAATMSFQKSRDEKKTSSQTLVTPSAVIAPPVAVPDSPTPVPSLAKPEFTFETAPSTSQSGSPRTAEHESVPKPAERQDETSRRSHAVKESAPPTYKSERARDKAPAKPKNVDFGI
jgi:hypothetical protein